jgi:hypothetical protein
MTRVFNRAPRPVDNYEVPLEIYAIATNLARIDRRSQAAEPQAAETQSVEALAHRRSTSR